MLAHMEPGDQALNSHGRHLFGDLWGLSLSRHTHTPPNPPTPRANNICFKIYKEQTIEVGVFVDRHLYKNMEEVLHIFLPVLHHRQIFLDAQTGQSVRRSEGT